jgi:hypothetical protein
MRSACAFDRDVLWGGMSVTLSRRSEYEYSATDLYRYSLIDFSSGSLESQ